MGESTRSNATIAHAGRFKTRIIAVHPDKTLPDSLHSALAFSHADCAIEAKIVAHLNLFRVDASALSQPSTRDPGYGNHYQPQEDLVQDDSESGLPSVVQDSQDIVAIEEQTADQIKLRPPDAIKNFHAMNTHGDLANSTQPISQSFYEPFIQRAKLTINESQDGHSTTQRTYEEGDCGHVDITSSFVLPHEQPKPEDQPDDLIDSEPVDFSQPQTQPKLTQFSESQRFKKPATETPTVAGRKRAHNGEVIDTPAPMRNPLIEYGQVTPAGILGLSQAFAATQAASSPVSNGLPTGPRSDRPSPNIDLQTRPMAATSSSPLMRPISNFRRTATEPAERYVPMKLSQAERQRHALSPVRRSSNSAEEFDSFNEVDSVIVRQQRRQDRKGKAERELKSLSSPIIPPKEYMVSSPPKPPPDITPEVSDDGSIGSVLTESPAVEDEEMRDDRGDIAAAAVSEAETEQDEDEQVHIEHSSQDFSHGEEDKENHSVLVPKTGPRHKFVQERSNSQVDASPSLRHGAHGLDVPFDQDIPSSDPLRIMDSQPSQNRTRFMSSSKDDTNTTSDVVDFVGQPSRRHGMTSLQDHRRYERTSISIRENGICSITGLSETNETTVSHNTASRNNTIPETSSEIRAGMSEVDTGVLTRDVHGKQSLTTTETEYVTAPTHTDLVQTLQSSGVSSPVRNTPPGRKRMRMLEINAESSPRRSQSQLNFDVEAILQLDEDHVAAEFLHSSPSRATTMLGPSNTTSNGSMTEGNATEPNELSHQSAATSLEHNVMLRDENTSSVSLNEVYVSPELSQEIVKPGRQQRTQQLTENLKGKHQPVEMRSATRRSIFDIQLSPEQPKIARSFEIQAQNHSRTRKQKTRPPPPTIVRESRMMKRLNPVNVQIDTTLPTAAPDRIGTTESSPVISHAEEDNYTTNLPKDNIIAPQMVLAHYKGDPGGYYPARLMGGSEGDGFLVQWEGYDPVKVDAYGLKALDLRIGDTVKVLADDFAKDPYIIQAFKDKVEHDDGGITDIRGYKTLLIFPKQTKRLSLDKSNQVQREVSIASIYLDRNMWTHMKGRTQDSRPVPSSLMAFDATTPSEQISTPSTPSSKTRRLLVSVLPTPVLVTPGFFSNMSFAISYDDTTQKNSIVNLIQTNGGLVINESFHDMLEPLSIELKLQYSNIGFTALLTDRHSRKEKYMQALALNLPCLSGKWIEACIKHKELLDWRAYLLPAGESAELDNATRSRILPFFDPQHAKLSEMLASRPNLFGETQVIVVVGRGKAEAKRAPYLFLIQALGAVRIHKVIDLKAAEDLLDSNYDEDVQWVFVDDKDVKTMQTLIDDGNNGAKKQKGRPSARSAHTMKSRHCRVAGNELIVQSLILGRLYES